MKINIYNPQGFEPWDWRNPGTLGIGGSETCQIELAQRLAKRGHRVTSYAPIPQIPCPPDPYGVEWLHNMDVDLKEDGQWIVFRSPGSADLFERNDLWHVSQDVSYFEGAGGAWSKERASKFSKIIALCDTHRDFLLKTYNYMKPEQVVVSSNGICSDRMTPPNLCAYNENRNPRRLIWASSPDRGLKELLHIFKRAKEFVEDLELHCYYGFDNWNKVIHNNMRTKLGNYDENIDIEEQYKKVFPTTPSCPQQVMRDEIMELLKQPDVHWHGRTNQPDLWKAFEEAGLWVYPTWFPETSCITCMEAQALGAIPITNPFWAVGHNVKHGVFVQGNTNEPITKCRYVAAIVKLAQDPILQQKIRMFMIHEARAKFDWERIADQYEGWLNV